MWESKPRWEATLSDGTVIYRNDEELRGSTWVAMRNYLLDNPHLKIVSFTFGFRDNLRSLPSNAKGYYFRNSIIGSLSGSKSSFLVGFLEDGVCKVEKWELPEMTFLNSEERPLEEAGESLILC